MTPEKVRMAREIMASMLDELPPDERVQRFTNGEQYNARQMAAEIRAGTDVGRTYASDLLRISRDLLARRARRAIDVQP